MIDLERAPLVQVAQRVIGERREMDHRIEASQIAWDDIADILSNGRHGDGIVTKRASFVEVGVETGDRVSRPHQHPDHHRTDIAVVPGYQYPHKILCGRLGVR